MKRNILLLTAALLLAACGKDPQPESQEQQPLLQRVETHRVLYDASGNLLADQEWTETLQWEYDAQRRVASITTDYTNYLGTEHSVQRNSYTADGKLAQASINDGAILARFSYPSDSRTLIDVATGGTPNYSIAIDHPNGMPTRIEERGAGGTWLYATELQSDNQNILRATCTQTGGAYTCVYGFQYQYDSHPSPTCGQFNLKEYSYKEFPTYYSHNNIASLHRTVSIDGQSDQLTYTHTYTYNASGYPLTCTTTATTSSGRREEKSIVYTYFEGQK